MSRKKPIVFCDFDGTFAEKDIGHRIFKHFSDDRNMELVKKWKAGEISSRECLSKEAAMIDVTPDVFFRFIDQFTLRNGAAEFYHKLKDINIPLYIVSDGADIYIKYVLEKYGMMEIPVFSNRVIISGNKYLMEFPYENDGCTRCGSCKGARIREVISDSGPEYEVIFIGDGLSDICAVPEADTIFARGDLLEFCRQKGIIAIEYKDFFDILNMLIKSGIIP
jgi:2-hydroxy-3-keto-5-methylthiopentenyl-1-phosphate phosphatase